MAEPFDLRLRVGSATLRLHGEVDDTPVGLTEMLPLLHQVTDAVVAAAGREVAARGRSVRCGPGCGACCRQLVPVSGVEAAALAGYVQQQAPARRRALERRFAEAGERLQAAGLLDRLREAAAGGAQARRALGLAYFTLGIPCPFLEDESCSIHALRPAACREYLVTSDPADCARPDAESVVTVSLPQRASRALYRLSSEEGGRGWLPLVLALEAEPGELPPRRATEYLERFLRALTADE